jgi:hypothetical protein
MKFCVNCDPEPVMSWSPLSVLLQMLFGGGVLLGLGRGGEVVEWTNLSQGAHPAPKLMIIPEQSRFAIAARDNWIGGSALLLGLVAITMTMRNGSNGKHDA